MFPTLFPQICPQGIGNFCPYCLGSRIIIVYFCLLFQRSDRIQQVEELFSLVKKIPAGTVVGYGAIGRVLPNRVSGLVVGRWMHHCPPQLPWWRVLGGDGSIKIDKLNPEAGLLQRQKLIAEGVTFTDDKVDEEFFLPAEALLTLGE